MATEGFRHKSWYNTIELEEGVFSDGHESGNIVATRTLLRTVDTRGFTALDVGATNGLFSTLLERKGCTVTAYDRVNRYRDQVEIVKKAYGVNFNHVTGVSFAEFCADHHSQNKPLYDIALCSGVLYHAFDPMAILCHVRSLVRIGGVVLLETAAYIDENPALYFNAAARYYPRSNYYQITTGWIDYVSRFINIRWLSTCYIYHEAPKLARVACVGIVEPHPVAEPEDTWMAHPCHTIDKKEFRLLSDYKEVDYIDRIKPFGGQVIIDGIGSVDITKTVQSTEALKYEPDLCRLHLADYD